MKATSPAITLHLSFSDFMQAMSFLKGGLSSKIALNRAIASSVFQKPTIQKAFKGNKNR
jgi:hypothetical protein